MIQIIDAIKGSHQHEGPVLEYSSEENKNYSKLWVFREKHILTIYTRRKLQGTRNDKIKHWITVIDFIKKNQRN